MRFPPSFLDELRARIPVSEIAGRRVKLRKQGREWIGLSPFNQEKTPSFTVNDQKGFYHDFSSGKHGDIFAFVMETEGLSFPDAVERLAALAGVPVPKASKEAEAQEGRRKTLHDVLELAAKFFETTLAAKTGARARGYLADRGLDPALQLKFRIGYAPAERFALKEHLGGQGVAAADMIEAGLLIAGDDIPVPYDRFRNRVMFPITDARGRVIAFGGRALEKDAAAKYLNSPETPVFHKGATLFNLATARAAAHQGAPVIAVEGYIDVIAMVSAGFAATVAPLGTALTEDQLQLLWKLSDEPVLCFDGDKAGERAAYRAADLALPHLGPGRSLRFAMLPLGQDPDDLVRAGGREAVAEIVAAARPLAEVIWTREVEGGRFDTPERRAALEARIGGLVAGIRDQAVRRHYRQEMENRLRRLFVPQTASERRAQPRRRPPMRGWTAGGPGASAPLSHDALRPSSPHLAASSIVRSAPSALAPREALILLAALNHPWLAEAEAETLAHLEFRSGEADRLRRALLDVAAQHPKLTSQGLREELGRRGLLQILSRVEAAVTHSSDWPAQENAAPEDVRRWWAHVVTLHHKARTLNRELKEAEQALGSEPSEGNLQWLRDVQERLAALEGAEALVEEFGALSGRPVRSF